MKEEKQIFDFFSHHPSEEWEQKCFLLKKGSTLVPFCARCAGAAIGIFLSLVWITSISVVSTSSEIWVLLPIPAFLDWMAYYLKGIHTGKILNAVTGVLLGAAVPIFYLNIFNLKAAYMAAAVGYATLFAYTLLFRNKAEIKA